MKDRIIPRTEIQGYYRSICKMSLAQRVVEAGQVLASPDSLVSTFAGSVAVFESYNNFEAFYSNKNRRPGAPDRDGHIGKSTHVAWHLSQKPVLTVANAPSLNAEYVDYEISPTRTTGRALFNDDSKHRTWRSGIFIDLLLANCEDRTPVVAELKILKDKDPFTALVQMLAGAAHLSSKSQYDRLCKFLPAGNFPATEHPRLDGYLLFHEFAARAQSDLKALYDMTNQLTAKLMERSEIQRHIRRIASIAIKLDGKSQVTGCLNWQHRA